MGAFITPANLTDEEADAFASEGFQCSGGFTYSTINVTLMEAGLPLADGLNTYDGSITPTYEDVAALYEVAEAADLHVGPEHLRGRQGPRVIANAFRAAMLRGGAVVWG